MLITACTPMTKDSYLQEYGQFIEKIKIQSAKPGFSWETSDKKFRLYNETLYEKFKDKMDTKDKMLCFRYKAYYTVLRHKEDAKAIAAETLEDMNFLIDQAKEVINDVRYK
jgi:hypothetical protein